MGDGVFGFSRYANRSAWLLDTAVKQAGQPVVKPFRLAESPTAVGSEAFTVDVNASGRELLLFFRSRTSLVLQTPALQAEAVDADGAVTPLVVTPDEHVAVVQLDPTRQTYRVRLTYLAPAPATVLEATALVPANPVATVR